MRHLNYATLFRSWVVNQTSRCRPLFRRHVTVCWVIWRQFWLAWQPYGVQLMCLSSSVYFQPTVEQISIGCLTLPLLGIQRLAPKMTVVLLRVSALFFVAVDMSLESCSVLYNGHGWNYLSLGSNLISSLVHAYWTALCSLFSAQLDFFSFIHHLFPSCLSTIVGNIFH